jgi:rod shape-determining protein MreD
MINKTIRLSLMFVFLILLQVLVFNNIQFSGYINPYIYLLFILLLPFEIPGWLLLTICFFAGYTVDLFSLSPGMHTFATVFAGFARPYVLRLVSPRDGYEPGSGPSITIYGFRWFFTYSMLMVLIHHTALFYIEVFRFQDFFRTLFRVLMSSVFSLAFILLLEFYRKGK